MKETDPWGDDELTIVVDAGPLARGREALVSDPNMRSRASSWAERAFSPMQEGSERGSVFMLVSGAIGAAVVVLPYTFGVCGIPISLLLLYLAAGLALLSLQVCCVAQRTLAEPTFDGVITKLFAKHVSVVCVCMLTLASFGLACVYLILASQTLQALVRPLGTGHAWWQSRQALVLVIEACFAGPLAFYRAFGQFRFASLIGVVAIGYLMFLTLGEFAFQPHEKAPSDDWWAVVSSPRGVVKSWSIFESGYIVHIFVFPVCDGLNNPTPDRVNKVIRRATGIEVIVYTLISLAGLCTFKHKTPQNLLLAFHDESYFVTAGRIAMLIQLSVAHTMMYHPTRRNVWALLRGSDVPCEAVPHVVLTAALVAAVTLVSLFFEQIVDLIGMVGGFCCVTYAYTLPAMMLWQLRGAEKQGPGVWWMNRTSTFCGGMALLVFAVVSGYASAVVCTIDIIYPPKASQ